MTYQTELAKTKLPDFAELYEFNCGGVISYYTSYCENITYLSHEYLARPIKRSEFSLTEKLKSVRVSITAPVGEDLAKYIANAPAETLYVDIIRLFLTTGKENLKIFSGEVINVTIAEFVAQAECETKVGVLRNKIPRFVFQSTCNHMLFDDKCNLSETDYKNLAVVVVSGSTLTSATFGTKPNGYFIGGHVRYANDIRLITNHVGNVITLQIPFDSRVRSGVTVEAYPGCDKLPGTCKTKFDNFINFLGFPYIPSSNPVIWGF